MYRTHRITFLCQLFIDFRCLSVACFCYFTPTWVPSIVISVSVCLPACLFVTLYTHISEKPHARISWNFLHLLPVAVARFFCGGNAIRYVSLLPVLWMTSHFYIIEQMGRIKDDAYVSSSLPGGGTGAKSAVSDCIVVCVNFRFWCRAIDYACFPSYFKLEYDLSVDFYQCVKSRL